MKRIAAWLVAGARTLRTMQLPGGELPAVLWSDNGEAYAAPAPLLSALAHDALGFADPRAPHFIGRLRDLVPSSFFLDIVSLRWGLRLSLANEAGADGTWQRHGRLGARVTDIATTACAAAAMLPGVKWRRERADPRPRAALQRIAPSDRPNAWSTLEAAHALRYFALLGGDTASLLARVRDDARHPPSDTATRHAIASALRVCGERAGFETTAAASTEGPLDDALRTATRLDAGDDGSPQLDDALARILRDDTPPSRWAADPYGNTRL
ncbi:MAG TPA: hypothetical protein VFO89_03065, partial [Thermoanaerobaculia bacterium]|nr:hypothetical protein [Thermoanaerobaculia bacterium]